VRRFGFSGWTFRPSVTRKWLLFAELSLFHFHLEQETLVSVHRQWHFVFRETLRLFSCVSSLRERYFGRVLFIVCVGLSTSISGRSVLHTVTSRYVYSKIRSEQRYRTFDRPRFQDLTLWMLNQSSGGSETPSWSRTRSCAFASFSPYLAAFRQELSAVYSHRTHIKITRLCIWI
jgi:hypothetical protein